MTAKEFVKSKMPNTRSERQRQNGGKVYWLIRDKGKTMWFASGDTESKTWVEAKKRILGID